MDMLSSPSISVAIAKASNTLTTCAVWLMESVAQLPIGQTVFRIIDRFLWIIEKSTQWSLPIQEITAEENGKTFGRMELVRPLPWILFLAVLIMLRIFRFGFNVGSYLLGYRRIEPGEMVKYVQKLRKRLRAIKTNGIKSLRNQRDFEKDCDSNLDGNKWRLTQLLRTIQLTLSSLSCLEASKFNSSPPPTRIKVHVNQESNSTPEERSTTESAVSPVYLDSKRKYSQICSENQSSDDSDEETILEKVDRLAAVNDSLDDDFTPADLSSQQDDSSSSDDSHISEAEVRKLKAEAKLDLNCPKAGIKDTTKEDPERTKSISTTKRTGEGEKVVNSKNNCTSGNGKDFYSPCKVAEDGETAFYSPISSASPSPDRMAPDDKEGQRGEQKKIDTEVTRAIVNGEKEAKTTLSTSGSTEKATNGMEDEKRGASSPVSKGAKPNNRNKRSITQASRKKSDGGPSFRPVNKKK